MSKASIAFFDIPYHSRVMTTLPIVRALVEAGYTVYAFGLEPQRLLYQSVGAQFVLQPAFGPGERDWTVNFRTLDYALTAVPALQETLRQLKPTLVMFTAKCLWAAIVAELLELPTIGIHTNVLMPRGAVVSERVFQARCPGVSEQELARREARDAEAWQRCQLRFSLERVHPLDVLPGLPNCMNLRGDLNLVYASEALQPQRELLDPSHHFVGPCYDTREADADPAFEQALATLPAPLLYASLGSMALYNERLDLFRLCLHTALELKWGTVMALGSEAQCQALKPELPDQAAVIIRAYVPQLSVLKRATVFITHAGTNGVYEALLAGVPLLMLPQGGDQPLIAEQVEQAGLGHWLSPDELTPTGLQRALERLRAAAHLPARLREASEGLRQAGGLPKVIRLVTQFVEQLPA